MTTFAEVERRLATIDAWRVLPGSRAGRPGKEGVEELTGLKELREVARDVDQAAIHLATRAPAGSEALVSCS